MFKENRKRFRVVVAIIPSEYTLRFGISSVMEIHYCDFSYYRPKNDFQALVYYPIPCFGT